MSRPRTSTAFPFRWSRSLAVDDHSAEPRVLDGWKRRHDSMRLKSGVQYLLVEYQDVQCANLPLPSWLSTCGYLGENRDLPSAAGQKLSLLSSQQRQLPMFQTLDL